MSKEIELLEEYKALAGKCDKASVRRMREIGEWLENHRAEIDGKEASAFLDAWLSEMEADNEEIKQTALRSQIPDIIYKLIPWKYIAETYFGKSQSWLAQRVNGYTVRGHQYTLSDDQKQTLNHALGEVGALIGSYRLA